MWQLRPNPQSQRKPCQHHGQLNSRNAQDHPAIGTWPQATPPPQLPPAAATPTTMPTRCILPHPRYKCPTRVFWSNPTCRWHLLPAEDHGHAGYSAWSNHDEFCWPAVPSKRWGCSNDAAANPAGNTHDGTLLCSQPADLLCPQPTASGVFLTSRGGQ